MTVKGILKAVWAFCSYLFVPQWGRHRPTREQVCVGKKELNGRTVESGTRELGGKTTEHTKKRKGKAEEQTLLEEINYVIKI